MDYYLFLKQAKPDNLNDFKECIKYVFDYVGIWCHKKVEDAKKINPTKDLLLQFYKRERDNLLNNLNYWDYVIKMSFFDWGIDYDIKEFYKEIEDLYYKDAIYLPLINKDYKELSKYCIQIENSIWIAFYNYQIQLLISVDKKEILKEFYPFYEVEIYSKFKTYLQLNIIEPYNDISYLYQRLKKEKLIHYIKQIDFINWLYKKELITSSIHKNFIDKGQLYSLGKSETPERKNKFDNHFNLN